MLLVTLDPVHSFSTTWLSASCDYQTMQTHQTQPERFVNKSARVFAALLPSSAFLNKLSIMVVSLRFYPFIFCLVSHPFQLAVAQCYLPGGNWVSDYVPCNSSAYASPCCKPGWTCFSNTLCIATDPSVIENGVAVGTAFRPACSTPQWNKTACGDVCQGW